MKIAVVADVHLHDLYGGYGWSEEGGGDIALRTLEDTIASTRVFNESYPAFLAVLDDIVQRDIRDVVLLGDYSDDGQPGAVAALKKILSSYETAHGLRFFATFGNHDSFGPVRRHQGKWLTKADGLDPVLVTSDENAASPAVAHSGMIGMSTADACAAMARYGLTRPEGVFHWETPLSNRAESAISDTEDLDTSYLVEPQEGLWLLILDANVFDVVEGKWQVRSNAAWDHVLARRPYVLDWIADISARAAHLGKTLLAFSHYPALPLALAKDAAGWKVACTPDWSARMPSLDAGRLLAKAGMRWHFSGHMHVSGRIELGGLVNIAVPSPVAYPGGYVVVTCEGGKVDHRLVRPDHTSNFDVGFSAYKAQAQRSGPSSRWDEALAAENYTAFLEAHLKGLVTFRHVGNDWPPELISRLEVPLKELFASDFEAGQQLNVSDLGNLHLAQLLQDYYLIRSGGREAISALPEARISLYRQLARCVLGDPQLRLLMECLSGVLTEA